MAFFNMYNAFHFNTMLKLNSNHVFSLPLPFHGAKRAHTSR